MNASGSIGTRAAPLRGERQRTMVPLPPELVNVLNDLVHGAEIEESLPEARRWVDRALEALEAEAGCTLSQADEAAVENARFLLRQLRGELARVPGVPPEARPALSEELTPAALDLAPLLQRIVQERRRSYFTDLPGFDALLVAGVAVIQGRGRGDALRERVPAALAELQALHGDYLRRVPSLPPDVRSALSHGYEQAMEGFEALRTFHDTGRMADLERALQRLKAGAGLLEVQARWRPTRPDSALPVGGPDLARLVASGLRGEDDFPEQRAHFRREVFPALARTWRAWADRLPLPLDLRDATLGACEEALEALELALEAAPPMALAAAAGRLEAVARQAGQAALAPDRALGTPFHDLARLLAGAWAGTVPDLLLVRQAASVLPHAPPEAAEHLQAYLDSGDRLHLLAALDLLL